MSGAELAKIMVLGYGNTLRSDDGVGPLVAETIAGLHLVGVETLVAGLLTPELADPISRVKTVVFVDASVDAPRDVQLRPCAPAESSQIMAHAADPKTMLALARDVYGHAPDAYLLTIPVENLAIGEELTPFAKAGMARAIELIQGLAR
jgi:hydrogenase maturation protease